MPDINDDLTSVLEAVGMTERGAGILARWDSVRRSLKSVKDELGEANAVVGSIAGAMEAHQKDLRVQVDRALAARGLDVATINQLQQLSAQASLLKSYQAVLDEQRDALRNAECDFESLRQERRELVEEQRLAFDRVTDVVRAQFSGRIAARRIYEGRKDDLESFLKGLHQTGVTRWWNDSKEHQRLTPDGILEALDAGQLEDFGMTPTVQKTFIQQFTPSKRRQLAALRCSDEYVLELMVDDGSYRPLSDLSGGQRVNLLLSLLLETNDERPLVIDQPEDELDNRFLFETMLPALRELKGSRQIIVATHNANIVVNGDADQVILLEATAERGHVARSGAIEDPTVRDAIVQTVDGGEEAFRSRQVKYGY